MFILERERDRERQTDRQEGRKVKTIRNPKQVPGSELSAQRRRQGSNPRTAHPGAPATVVSNNETCSPWSTHSQRINNFHKFKAKREKLAWIKKTLCFNIGGPLFLLSSFSGIKHLCESRKCCCAMNSFCLWIKYLKQ